MERLTVEKLAKHFAVSVEQAQAAQDDIGFMYRELTQVQQPAPTDFLIQTSEEHTQLMISRVGDMLSIHTNCRTLMLSSSMAEELMKGLMAILKGGFSRALSETSLRLEEEETAKRNNRAPPTSDGLSLRDGNPSRRESPNHPLKPELDQL